MLYALVCSDTAILVCVILITQVVDGSRGRHLRRILHSLAVKASIMTVIIDIADWHCVFMIVMMACLIMFMVARVVIYVLIMDI